MKLKTIAILAAFAQQARRLLTSTDPQLQRFALHLLAEVSADDPELVRTVRDMLEQHARLERRTLDAALHACGNCFRRTDDLDVRGGLGIRR